MRNHWARTAHLWPPGTVRETWLVPLARERGVAALAARIAPALDLPHLDVVPPTWLHLTLDRPPEHAVTVRIFPPAAVDEGVVLAVDDPDGALGAWPHVALAYARGDGPAPAFDGLALQPVTVTIGSAARVRLRREPGFYAWEVLETVPLRDA